MIKQIVYSTILVSLISFSEQLLGQSFTNVAQSMSIQTSLNTIDNYGASVSFYDFNQDGLDDLTFAAENDSILFYRNTGSGFEKVNLGIYGDGQVKQVLWVDVDNDFDFDLFISTYNGTPRLLVNDGNFSFSDNSVQAGLPSISTENYGASFADFNNDGFLDFYLANYNYGYTQNEEIRLNRLFKNNGDGSFSNITLTAGVGDSIKTSFQGLWFDYNRDGWIDLYVINDRYPFENTLFKNNGDETFTDITDGTGLEFPGGNPMTATIDDFNNDGYPDIYLTNIGNGNPTQHFVNNGDGTFTEQSQILGTQIDIFSWGAVWIDYDNDTWQDLYVASGHPFNLFAQEESKFFKNQDGQYFTSNNNSFQSTLVGKSHSVAKGDINNDGFYDIVSYNDEMADPFLWLNSGFSNNFVKLTLEGTSSNYNAIGANIQVFANGSMYSKSIYNVENYISQNSQHIIFGLGEAQIIDSIKVIYPSGLIDRYYNVQANTHHYLSEGETTASQIEIIGDSVFCDNSEVTLNIDTQNPLIWNQGSDSTHITTNSSGNYFALIQEQGFSYYSDTLSINFSQMPEIIEDITNVSCTNLSDGSAELFINSTINNSEYWINWSNGDLGNTIENVSSGTYYYYYSDIFGCADTASVEIGNPSQIFAIYDIQDETFGMDGKIDLVAFGGLPPYTFYIDGIQSEPPFEDLNSGSYLVEIIDDIGCIYDSLINVSSILGTTEQNGENISVSPNPFKGRSIKIHLPNSLDKLELALYNTLGKTVFAESYSDLNKGIKQISIPELPSGIYHLKISSPKHTKNYKLLKQ